jgi:hypothetical protein
MTNGKWQMENDKCLCLKNESEYCPFVIVHLSFVISRDYVADPCRKKMTNGKWQMENDKCSCLKNESEYCPFVIVHLSFVIPAITLQTRAGKNDKWKMANGK